MSEKAPTIAFFGATGGVTNAALVHALRAGHHVIALARTPSRLTSQLETQGLSNAILNDQLTIITGDALDKKAVKQTITANRNGFVVHHIVTGLGGAPSLTWTWSRPLEFLKIDNPNICADAASTLIAALDEVYATNPELKSNMPKLTFVSTTGISNGVEDVPFGLRMLYHGILAQPHADKREMERLYRDSNDRRDGGGPVFDDIVGVRPTLLTGAVAVDSGVGLENIRAGVESKPETGYSISRADVGHWIYVNALDETKRQSWKNEMVSLTS